nr:hypothetical protein [Brucella intermedia]
MAIRPDYDIGTVTLTSGSSDFTTSGSSLQTAAVQAGDAIIAPSGHVLIIATITGQNSGTLFLPCPAAAAGTALPLRIRFQPDGSRYQGAVRVLIDLLSSGNLEAFAALVGADGMVPIFTGPGTLDLADPATFGIQDPNGSLGKLAALTLAARQILQTDQAGALTALTLAARQILQTDVNGALKAVALAANKALVTDANRDVQQIDLSTIGRSILNMDGSADQLIRGDGTLIPILGTMDAGALMETGNNANGSYFRFRSGLQITARVSSTFTIQSPAGNIFVNGAAAPPYTLPATFSAEPYELITGHNLSGTGHCWAASVTRPTTTQSSSIQLFRATADAGPFFFKLVHIGRWQ